MRLNTLCAHELHQRLKKGDITSTEITEACIKEIEAQDSKYHAFITPTFEQALDQAKRADRLIRSDPEKTHPLTGIPIAIKDNLCVKGTETTCASKILRGFIAPYDATAVDRLRQIGAVFIGKTNMDEFAMGSSNENSSFGCVRNPWDLERVPGGSSGGSCVAVASGESILALGTDTGGSIRQPASFCGVVGLKPTYGRVSRYGLIAYASSLDQIGPIARDVRDVAILLQAISGWDCHDSTSVPCSVPQYEDSLVPDLHGLKIGVPEEYFASGIDTGVKRCVEEALDVLRDAGAYLEQTSLPHTEYAVATYYLIATAEASSNLARYDGVEYGFRDNSDTLIDMYKGTRSKGFGKEVKRRIMLGTYVLSSGYYDQYYLKALKARSLIKQDFDKAFQKFEAMVTPVSPSTAFRIGEKISDPIKMYLSDIFTISANLAGIPGMSIPCGIVDGLPVGLQILAPPFQEETLLRIGYAFETRFSTPTLKAHLGVR